MSLAALKTNRFSSANELCAFVNDNQISVIEQIVLEGYVYVLFYR